ncbi:N-acetylmuramoyl-L-alanine amidase family protein [Clostridium akagii]|uniref:N-acetylmuramoyl-L-alanine amidase family protein n=1 Tax=Clostridium akagii TaxID=91623 RepID=UPI00068FC5B4|nr:N-acetylmuramoyl-L-alanine amidase [Clostridium akagii]
MRLILDEKSRRKFFLRLSIIILILLIILALIVSGIEVNSNKKNNKASSTSKLLTDNNKLAVKIPKNKDGNIYMEQNNIFKKYTINIASTNKNVTYKQDDSAIVISFDKNSSLILNSGISDSNSTDIYLNNDNGKENLVIKKNYKENNFVNINEGNDKNQVIILISKVKKPLTHKAVLNPGHGGMDSGISVGSIHEKDITLRIVKLMVSDLEYNGVGVVLTRDKDEGQALADIADFVNKINPDVFMSVHVNGMDGYQGEYQGIGTYYYNENGYQTSQRISLANIILKHATASDGWKNDGVVKDKLKVIRLSKPPSVLVEAGYLTNNNDRARLQNDKVLGNLSKNLSLGIVEYVNKK